MMSDLPDFTRRRMLRAGVTAAGAAVGLAAVGAPQARAGTREETAGTPHGAGRRGADCEEFDEFYRGRHIVGRCTDGGPHGHADGSHRQADGPRRHADGSHRHAGAGPHTRVFIDGEELHLMSNADGTYVSIVNHFEPSPTPRSVARLAVDDLAGADLVPPPVPPGH